MATLALAGCGTKPGTAPGTAPSTSGGDGLKTQPRTAQEYYVSAQLRAATLASCTATSEAEVDANLKLPACQAAMLAEKHRQLGLGAPR